MSESQDSDDIYLISRRLETVTTMESVSTSQQRLSRSNRSSMGPRSTAETRVKSEYNDVPGRKILPPVNLPEKIILIIDVTKEKNCTDFKLGNGATYGPLFMIKRVVEIFVKGKSMIKKNHEFAVMTLSEDTMKWICDFTSNVKQVLAALEPLVEEPTEGEGSFDLSSLFEALDVHVAPFALDSAKDVPPFVTRAILIYARSNCVPNFLDGRQYLEQLYDNPTFFLDCLYVHELPSDNNRCEIIYAQLGALDARNSSYILEVGRNATKLHDNMAKLLAHPLQRPLQKRASYAIGLPANAEDSQTDV